MSDIVSLSFQEEAPASLHPVTIYLASLGSDNSRRSVRSDLNTIAKTLTNGQCDAMTLPWSSLRRQHVQGIRAYLQQKYAPTTANRMLNSLKAILKETWRLGQIDADTLSQAIDVKPVRGVRPMKGRALSQEEVTAIMTACENDSTIRGIRDAAILAILRACGLRRSEVIALETRDVDLAAGTLLIRAAKGNKTRVAFISSQTAPKIKQWLDVRASAGLVDGAVFLAIKSNHIVGQGLTDQSIADIVSRRCKEAGITAATTCHDFRRTAIGELFDAGVDVATIQKLAGHSSPSVSVRYDRRGDDAARRAVEKLRL